MTGILYGIVIAIVGIIAGNRSGFFAFGFGFYILIVLSSFIPFRWENKKKQNIIKWLSSATYSVYLTHGFILQLFGNVLRALPWIVGYVLFIVIAWLVGGMAYSFIEKPIYKICCN